MSDFPSRRWPELRRVLERKPLRYAVTRQNGSHRTLESSAGYPPLHLSFHDLQTIPGGLVRKILCNDVGLTREEARRLL